METIINTIFQVATARTYPILYGDSDETIVVSVDDGRHVLLAIENAVAATMSQ